MTTPADDSSELLRHEIFEEARRRKNDVLCRAWQEAKTIAAKGEKEAERFRAERLEAAMVEARRRTEATLATAPVEIGRMRLARIEELLRCIYDRARERLKTRIGFDYRKTIVHLCAEALLQMAGEAFRLRLSVADGRTLGDRLVEEIQRCPCRPGVAIQLVEDPKLRDGEVLLEDEEGRQVCNLSLDVRLERCWPELRQQIAVHAGFVEQVPP